MVRLGCCIIRAAGVCPHTGVKQSCCPPPPPGGGPPQDRGPAAPRRGRGRRQPPQRRRRIQRRRLHLGRKRPRAAGVRDAQLGQQPDAAPRGGTQGIGRVGGWVGGPEGPREGSSKRGRGRLCAPVALSSPGQAAAKQLHTAPAGAPAYALMLRACLTPCLDPHPPTHPTHTHPTPSPHTCPRAVP